jgi:putative FmdB family regulatory protein
MPIYEYQCDACGVFEVSQRITEDPLKKCPTCKAKVRRLISNTSFMLKGSGWYVTDYGRSKPSTSSTADSGTTGNGKSSDSASSSTTSAKSSSGEKTGGEKTGSDKATSNT